jgi:hypothetical protein
MIEMIHYEVFETFIENAENSQKIALLKQIELLNDPIFDDLVKSLHIFLR